MQIRLFILDRLKDHDSRTIPKLDDTTHSETSTNSDPTEKIFGTLGFEA